VSERISDVLGHLCSNPVHMYIFLACYMLLFYCYQVTLVDNLECYGISPVDFAHSMQKLAAASTTSL